MSFFALQLADHPGVWDNLQFQAVGFSVVMMTLAFLWITLEITGKIFRSLEARGALAAADGSAPRNAPAQAADGDLDPETLAVIAAAVSAAVDCPHRITSVKICPASHQKLQAWSLEGRRKIHSTRRSR